jgi:hypothetical protein
MHIFQYSYQNKGKEFSKLEFRESDVSLCEQYSLGEMARTKIIYEN